MTRTPPLHPLLALVIAPAFIPAFIMMSTTNARAYDAGTTHAGLTSRAISASSLVKRLGPLFGLPSGLFETLRYEPTDEAGRNLKARLDRLDPAGGYLPDGGRLPARSWIVAGSVLEETPPLRRRNHFFDPVSGKGLTGAGLWKGFGRGVAAVASGVDSFRDLFVGDAFDGTGIASTEWLTSKDNHLGLPRFLDARERAVIAQGPAERESAIAETLLVAGALLHVIEDAGDPPYVHNDFRVDLFRHGDPYDRFVTLAYGRLALPPPASPVAEAAPAVHLADLIHDAAGNGLADRTARRFYSFGLFEPESGATRPKELPPLVAGPQSRGYLVDAQKHHLARFQRGERGELHWDMDNRCYADQAAVLLPEVGETARAALEQLFRDALVVDGDDVKNGPLALGAGKVTVLSENEDGMRRVVTSRDVTGIGAGETLAELPQEKDRGRKVAVIFRGSDGGGEPIVVSAEIASTSE